MSSIELNILQYNIFCRPRALFKDGQVARARDIPKVISEQINSNVDVITFCEAFDDVARRNLISELNRVGFRYVTNVVGEYGIDETVRQELMNKRMCFENGGVMIVSRHPILKSESRVFTDFEISGTDALAAKGMVYVKINVDGKLPVHVFAAHFQAWNTRDAFENRNMEAIDIRHFIDSFCIPSDEAVIISGDFNSDYIKYPGKTNTIFKYLDAVMPPRITHMEQYTSDPDTNTLVGRDGQKRPYRHEWLDYILYSKSHKAPVGCSLQSLPIKSNYNISLGRFLCCCFRTQRRMPTRDLSDHYPVLAKFRFQLN